LVLTGKKLTDQILLDVRIQLRDSNVPHMVDVIAESEINDENIKREINKTGQILYSQIPTEDDWANPNGDLDIQWARKHFFEKTIEDAEKLFVKNALYYQEAIMFMPSIPFRYYIHAYMNYLLGKQSQWDTDGASCFLYLVGFKIKFDQDILRTVWLRVKETIEHIRKNPDWFDWNEAIYGNLDERTAQLLNWHEQF
jgi:hypothetical protein